MSDRDLDRITIDMLLAKLTSQDREIIVLYFIEGYSLLEVTEAINKRYRRKNKKTMVKQIVGLRILKIIRKLQEYAGECPKESETVSKKGLNTKKKRLKD